MTTTMNGWTSASVSEAVRVVAVECGYDNGNDDLANRIRCVVCWERLNRLAKFKN